MASPMAAGAAVIGAVCPVSRHLCMLPPRPSPLIKGEKQEMPIYMYMLLLDSHHSGGGRPPGRYIH